MTAAPSTHPARILSGMRPTGRMHLGHYHGVLKSWLQLQHEYECFFCAADWHALTTHYDEAEKISTHVWDMIVDWLAVGVNPGSAHIFIQSKVPEHAELMVLLSMITPLSWLERVPTYKDQQEKITHKDLTTFGFLGYPLLQSVDILIYKATQVPVGEDQVSHIEFAREIARRFNHLYGRDKDFVEKAESAITKLGKKTGKLYAQFRKAYQEHGDEEALATGRALLSQQAHISMADRERLLGYLEGSGRIILPEPEGLFTPTSKFIGLDGQKMSKSYHNTIPLRETPEQIATNIRTMPTDPARVRRSDPGEPEKCPVWNWHEVYSDSAVQDWVQQGCRSAGIGCLDCKQPVIDAVQNQLKPIRQRAREYEEDMSLVRSIVAEGCEHARDVAHDTLQEVRAAMGFEVA